MIGQRLIIFHIAVQYLLGLFVCSFYHFFVNDKEGIIGNLLRNNMPIAKIFDDMDEKTFACCFVGLFMQVTGILQMPEFLGPSFTPFEPAITWTGGKSGEKPEVPAAVATAADKKDRSLPAVVKAPAEPAAPAEGTTGTSKDKKKRKNKKKAGDKEKES